MALQCLTEGISRDAGEGSLSGSAVIALEVIALNERFELDIRKNFFFYGVVRHWNSGKLFETAFGKLLGFFFLFYKLIEIPFPDLTVSLR